MPIYVQIIAMVTAFIIFVFLLMYLAGLGMRRLCWKIIAEMEQAGAYSEKRAIALQEERENFFRVGTKNLRPKALNVLMAEGLVTKTPTGKYFLNKEKIAALKNKSQNH